MFIFVMNCPSLFNSDGNQGYLFTPFFLKIVIFLRRQGNTKNAFYFEISLAGHQQI